MSAEQKPSVGRIVHVFNRQHEGMQPIGRGPYAAIVCKVHPDGTSIMADCFPRGSLMLSWHEPVPYSDKNGNVGRDLWWDWPQRV